MAGIKDILKNDPRGLVARAYGFSELAHKDQKRKSGEAYFMHPLAAAEILHAWHLDDTTIAAGLLHDTVEDTGASLDQIRKEFGEDVAFLVDGVTKLGHIKYRGAAMKVENLRKMVLALSKDLRVVFIKLADRLHNMRTLDALPPAKQKRIALETDEIYAPLAYRLGMQNLAGELHDLAFPYLYPEEDRWLKKSVEEQYEKRLAYLEQIKPELERILKAHEVTPRTIDFRAKRYSSLYHKLLSHEMNIEKIHDLVAMRVILDTVPECYAALGAIHQAWPPLPGRIKDYIAMPKPNSYRSLHTTVIGPGEKVIEIQIRTKEMHDANEHGIAAHWLYDQKKTGGETAPKNIARELQWVEQLKNWQETYRGAETNPEEFLQAMKIDFFKDRIFAITPRGDVIDLPKDATPIDFGYHIHSVIGDTAVGAKVNHQIVPLDHKLSSGDLVEIVTQKNKKPSEDWLIFVKTAAAREHIRAALRTKKNTLSAQRVPTKMELKITVQNRLGLLKDISEIIARSHINILGVNSTTHPGGHFGVMKIQCGIADREKIEKLILKIKKLKEVREIGFKLI